MASTEQSLKPAYLHYLQKKKRRNEQDVTVHDILIQATAGEFESPHPAQMKRSRITRLLKTIKLLFSITEHHHETTLRDERWQDDIDHHITRLITPEFSFYTNHQPLSDAQFLFILGKLETYAENLHPNIHFVLSSFAVLSKNNTLLNITLHIQCGLRPLIRPIIKKERSPVDKRYRNFSNSDPLSYYPVFNSKVSLINQEHLPDGTPLRLSNAMPLAEVKICDIAHDHELLKEYEKLQKKVFQAENSVVPDIVSTCDEMGFSVAPLSQPIVCCTQGGVRFMTVIGVCRDHCSGVDYQTMLHAIEHHQSHHDAFPRLVSQIIVSSQVNPQPAHCLSEGSQLVHADAVYGCHVRYANDEQNTFDNIPCLAFDDERVFDRIIGEFQLQKHRPHHPVRRGWRQNRYGVEEPTLIKDTLGGHDTELELSENGEMQIKSPPFGEDMRVIFQIPRRLPKLNHELRSRIERIEARNTVQNKAITWPWFQAKDNPQTESNRVGLDESCAMRAIDKKSHP